MALLARLARGPYGQGLCQLSRPCASMAAVIPSSPPPVSFLAASSPLAAGGVACLQTPHLPEPSLSTSTPWAAACIGLGAGGAAALCRRRGAETLAASRGRRLWRRAEAPGTEARVALELEVTKVLREVKDEGLGADIITLGFAGDVEVDPSCGQVSFKLEVLAFEERARAAVQKLPWVKSVQVRGASAASAPKPTRPPPPPGGQRPMPKMPPTLDKVKSIVAVSSCKGGVGKSTVAVNLAFELQKTGAKVGIFDCDVYGPSLPVMVRFDEMPQMTMYEDENKQKHIVPVVHKETGIKLVSFGYAGKAAVMRGSMVTGVISQFMQQTDWGELDYLILDMPPGTGDIHLTLAQTCQITAAVIVTTPQKLSTIDVERGISMFSQLAVPSIAVVQNMSYITLPDGNRQYPFGNTAAGREIAETFGIDHVYEMPIDPDVSEAGDGGRPFVTHSEGAAAKEIGKLGEAVVKEVDKIKKGSKRPVVTYDEENNTFVVELPEGETFRIDPTVLRLRDKGAGGATRPQPGAKPAEVRDMGNYAIVIRWSDGFVQVAPHKQLIFGDEKGPMPRLEETPA